MSTPGATARTHELRALIIGIGDAFSRHYFGSSALLDAPDGYVLLDCPGLIHRAIHAATSRAGWTIDADSIHDVILTHLHGDHCGGLEAFGFWRWQRRLEDPTLPIPRVHTSRSAADRLWERLSPAMDRAGDRNCRLEDFFEMHVLDPDHVARVAGLSVRCRFGTHSIPSLGLLLSDGTWTLGWSGDTAFDPRHVAWLSEADILVHESNRGPTHTPIAALNSLPEQLQRKMRLIHLPDDFAIEGTAIPRLTEGSVLSRPAARRSAVSGSEPVQ